MKRKPIIIVVILFMLLLIALSCFPQQVQCQSTLDSWKMDRSMKEYMATHKCDCSNGAYAMPVCMEIKVPPKEPPKTPPPAPTDNQSGSSSPNGDNTASEADREREQERERQLQLQRERERNLAREREMELARQRKFAEEKSQLLATLQGTSTGTLGLKGGSSGTLGLKGGSSGTLGLKTSFEKGTRDSAPVDLRVRQEQIEFENMNAAWIEKQRKLIQQRTEAPNKWCSAIYKSLMSNVPLPPSKNFNELQPGDVLLIEAKGGSKAIAWADNKATSTGLGSCASHTVIFLKEVNGKKLFLDNQPLEGPRIISEAEYGKIYGSRGAEVATLVGQPLKPEEGKKLFQAAVKMAQENRKKTDNNLLGSRFLGTNYGAFGADRVCSEADWALINATGRNIPKSGDQTKVKWGVDFSPADFQNQRYFLITPVVMPK